MKVVTVPGQTYVVYAAEGATITAPGVKDPLLTCEGGKPNYVTVPGGEMEISDPEATYAACRNFKNAALALGLLGGGDNGLPAGYTRVEFLESTGGQGFMVDTPVTSKTGVYVRFMQTSNQTWTYVWGGRNVSTGYIVIGVDGRGAPVSAGALKNHAELPYSSAAIYNSYINYKNDGKYMLETKEAVSEVNGSMFFTAEKTCLFGSCNNGGTSASFTARAKVYAARFTNESELVREMLPCVDATGTPCMYDLVSKQPFRNEGSGQFIAGFTLAQARKLGKLPAGTTLTVSLPVGYDSDAGVINALAQAQENGCVLTIQTYEAAGAAAATFALRRVWVRRTPDALGTYVDADGTRWLVEWCVDVIGADPETLGYERFRSVDAAVDYWRLQPYQYTEDEQLLTEA